MKAAGNRGPNVKKISASWRKFLVRRQTVGRQLAIILIPK